MKTAIEIPDALSRRAKSAAAEQGISFREFVSQAPAEKLRVNRSDGKPWMKAFGQLRNLSRETARINQIVAEEFGRIEPES